MYLLCDGEKFKIGMTTRKTIEDRVAELQTGNPNEIFVSMWHKTNHPDKVEKLMHARYGMSRIRNEWFDLTVEQVLGFNTECEKCEHIIEVLKDNPFF